MLRTYQSDAIENLRNLVKSGKKRIVLVLPTGGGKTMIAAHIAKTAVDRGHRVGFFAHRVELLRQTKATFERTGIARVGAIAGGEEPDDDAPAHVISIDAFRNREKPKLDVIFVDEAHRSMATSYRAHIFEAYPNAIIIGLTATPERLDGQGLGTLYEEMIVVATPAELIESGHIVKPRLFSHPIDVDLNSVRSVCGDYHLGDLEEAMRSNVLVGNIVSHWQKMANNERTFVFAVGVEHSKKITQTFCDAGIAAVHVDAETPKNERLQALINFETGKTRVLSSCGLFIEGVDIPSARCAILARPTKSVTVYLQSVGRVLRPWHGLGSLILDHAGNAVIHGKPWEEREWSLEGRQKKKKNPFKTKVCESCFAILEGNPKECPECGAELFVGSELREEPTEVGGELEELADPTSDNAENDTLDPLGLFVGFTRWGMLSAEQIAFVKTEATKLYTKGQKPGALHFRFMERWPGQSSPYAIKQRLDSVFFESDYWTKTNKRNQERREYWERVKSERDRFDASVFASDD